MKYNHELQDFAGALANAVDSELGENPFDPMRASDGLEYLMLPENGIGDDIAYGFFIIGDDDSVTRVSCQEITGTAADEIRRLYREQSGTE